MGEEVGTTQTQNRLKVFYQMTKTWEGRISFSKRLDNAFEIAFENNLWKAKFHYELSCAPYC